MDPFQSQILISLLCFSIANADTFTNYGIPAGWNGYNSWNTYQDAFGNRLSSSTINSFNQQRQRVNFASVTPSLGQESITGFYGSNNAVNMAQSMANKQREVQSKLLETQLKIAEKQREHQHRMAEKENEGRLKMAEMEREIAAKQREFQQKMDEKQRDLRLKLQEKDRERQEKDRERRQKQTEREREHAQLEQEWARMAQYYANYYYNQGYPMQNPPSPSSDYFQQSTPSIAANSPPFVANPPPPQSPDNDDYSLYDNTNISTITTNGVTFTGTTRDLCRRKLLTCKNGSVHF